MKRPAELSAMNMKTVAFSFSIPLIGVHYTNHARKQEFQNIMERRTKENKVLVFNIIFQ